MARVTLPVKIHQPWRNKVGQQLKWVLPCTNLQYRYVHPYIMLTNVTSQVTFVLNWIRIISVSLHAHCGARHWKLFNGINLTSIDELYLLTDDDQLLRRSSSSRLRRILHRQTMQPQNFLSDRLQEHLYRMPLIR